MSRWEIFGNSTQSLQEFKDKSGFSPKLPINCQFHKGVSLDWFWLKITVISNFGGMKGWGANAPLAWCPTDYAYVSELHLMSTVVFSFSASNCDKLKIVYSKSGHHTNRLAFLLSHIIINFDEFKTFQLFDCNRPCRCWIVVWRSCQRSLIDFPELTTAESVAKFHTTSLQNNTPKTASISTSCKPYEWMNEWISLVYYTQTYNSIRLRWLGRLSPLPLLEGEMSTCLPVWWQ